MAGLHCTGGGGLAAHDRRNKLSTPTTSHKSQQNQYPSLRCHVGKQGGWAQSPPSLSPPFLSSPASQEDESRSGVSRHDTSYWKRSAGRDEEARRERGARLLDVTTTPCPRPGVKRTGRSGGASSTPVHFARRGRRAAAYAPLLAQPAGGLALWLSPTRPAFVGVISPFGVARPLAGRQRCGALGSAVLPPPPYRPSRSSGRPFSALLRRDGQVSYWPARDTALPGAARHVIPSGCPAG